jgi:hypothetical protein
MKIVVGAKCKSFLLNQNLGGFLFEIPDFLRPLDRAYLYFRCTAFLDVFLEKTDKLCSAYVHPDCITMS